MTNFENSWADGAKLLTHDSLERKVGVGMQKIATLTEKFRRKEYYDRIADKLSFPFLPVNVNAKQCSGMYVIMCDFTSWSRCSQFI